MAGPVFLGVLTFGRPGGPPPVHVLGVVAARTRPSPGRLGLVALRGHAALAPLGCGLGRRQSRRRPLGAHVGRPSPIRRAGPGRRHPGASPSRRRRGPSTAPASSTPRDHSAGAARRPEPPSQPRWSPLTARPSRRRWSRTGTFNSRPTGPAPSSAAGCAARATRAAPSPRARHRRVHQHHAGRFTTRPAGGRARGPTRSSCAPTFPACGGRRRHPRPGDRRPRRHVRLAGLLGHLVGRTTHRRPAPGSTTRSAAPPTSGATSPTSSRR